MSQKNAVYARPKTFLLQLLQLKLISQRFILSSQCNQNESNK